MGMLFGISLGNAQTNLPPVVTATGDLTYCPLTATSIVDTFNIVDPDDTEIDAFFVQISVGYERGFDTLTLTGNHPNITTSWDVVQGKLSIRGLGGGPVQYVDLIAAIPDIDFESTVQTPIPFKQFSFTIGVANYLPQTDHYYEYVAMLGISWQDARVAAEGRTFFGLQGYLATLTSIEEAKLAGEQASGAGWIGGSDAEQEGVWRWMTGPEAGTVFWNGNFSGSTPNFAFWNSGEPNNVLFDFDPSGEDYAHVTSPNVGVLGSWNDLPNLGGSGDFQPKGYVVEYGGLPGEPILQLSASTTLITPVIESVQDNSRCDDGAIVLTASASAGTVLWFDAESGGNLLFTGPSFTTPILSATTIYYVAASENGCLTGQRVPVEATVYPLPEINPNVVFENCDADGVMDGFTDFNLDELIPVVNLGDYTLDISFHANLSDANNAMNPILGGRYNNGLGGVIYARAENSSGCFAVSEIVLQVSSTSFPANYQFVLEVCDEDEQDGFYPFNLEAANADIRSQFPVGQNLAVTYYRSFEDALLEENRIQNEDSFTNETAFSQTLFVRVENGENGNCFGIGPHLQLQVLPLVDFSLAESELILCSGSFVQAGVLDPDGDYDYQWLNADGEVVSTAANALIESPGTYSVTATSEFGCISPAKELVVHLSEPPTFIREVFIVSDNGNTNSITLVDVENVLGVGDYEYALDSPFGPFQDSPTFNDVQPGLHTYYANDKNGCGADQFEIGVVGVSKFITPNSDGNNDELVIKGVTTDVYSSAELSIMDRYGKLLAQISAFGSGWNGRYNGIDLPSSDYWYVLTLVDLNGELHRRTGHFTIKR